MNGEWRIAKPINWKTVTEIIKRYWIIYVLIAVAGIIAAFLWNRYSPVIYEANALILIKESQEAAALWEQQPAISGIYTSTVVDRLPLLIKSPGALHFVAQELNRAVPVIFSKGKFGKSEIGIIQDATIINKFTCDEQIFILLEYQLSHQNTCSIHSIKAYLADQNGDPLHELNALIGGLDPGSVTIKGKCFNVKVNLCLSPLNKYQSLILHLSPSEIYAKDLLDRTTVTLKPGIGSRPSGIGNIILKGGSPRRLTYDMDVLVRAFNNMLLEYQKQGLNQTERFLSTSISSLKNEINVLTEELRSRVTASSEQVPEMGIKTDETLNYLQRANTAVAIARNTSLNNEQDTRKALIRISLLLQGIPGAEPVLQLINKLAELNIKQQELLSELESNHPAVRLINDQKEALWQQLITALHTLKSVIQEHTMFTQITPIPILKPDSGIPIQDIQAEIETRRKLLSDMYSMLVKVRVIKASLVEPIQVINNPAETLIKTSPKPLQNYLLGIAASVFISMLHLIWMYLFNRKVWTIDDITEVINTLNQDNLRLVGLVPYIKDVPRHSNDLPNVSEILLPQLEQICTSLIYRFKHGGTLLVTSSIPGEGKTLLANLIGYLLCNMFKSSDLILIVDGDFRKPSLKRFWNIESCMDWTHLIATSPDRLDQELSKVICRPHLPQAEFTPAILPLNPKNDQAGIQAIPVLTHPAIHNIFNRLRQDFKWIIIDCAPMMVAAEIGLWLSMSDAVLYIVYTNKVRFSEIKTSLKRLIDHPEATKKPIMLVLNAVKISRKSKYGYYNYYGYYTYNPQYDKKS